MPPLGFEPTILAGERPHTYPLDRAANGTGCKLGVAELKLERFRAPFGLANLFELFTS
jgi:hypothetical protein